MTINGFLAAVRRNFHGQFELFLAQDVESALEIVTERDIAVAVCDYRMPQEDGLQFMERLRRQSPATQRILLTGYPGLQVALDAVNKAAVLFMLSKPSPPRVLESYIERALAEYNAHALAEQTQNRQGDDALTGCWTRQAAEEHLRRLGTLHQNACVLVVDIAGLRNINETYGCIEGDRVLRVVASLLRSFVRDDRDLLARWGDDRFLLVLPGYGVQNMERLLARLSERIQASGYSDTAIALRHGTSSCNGHVGSIASAVAEAERHLLENRVVHGPIWNGRRLTLHCGCWRRRTQRRKVTSTGCRPWLRYWRSGWVCLPLNVTGWSCGLCSMTSAR